MATIVLTAVGTLFGGPIGGAIGAALGQRLDQAVLGGGKGREGPRLKELDVQTSSYGTQIPAIFGAMRVAGTVIWSTDLIEARVKSGGGKGRPSTVNYSYSASFAVALSSRPVGRIGRIWADGNLLRGAAGDFKTETIFRFHSGHGDQVPDPLLASAEAMGQCPAHRGIAYAVFEDLQLADFGNRIPSLTFEIFEREGEVQVGEIAQIASADTISGESSASLIGYALQGQDCRSALQPLLEALPLIVAPAGDGVRLSDWGAPVEQIIVADPAITDGTTRHQRPGRSRSATRRAPASISVRHYDPERDFQAGVQTSRQIGSAQNGDQIDLPASVAAGEARRFADLQLLQRWRSLNGISLSAATSPAHVRAGQQVVDAGSGVQAQIVEIEHFRGSARIVAAEWPEISVLALAADPGRNQAEPDLSAGTTRLAVADLPALDSVDPGRAVLVASASGTGPGWRRAALSIRDGTQSLELGSTNGVATIGQLAGSLSSHSAMLLDEANQPVVQLLHEGLIMPPGSGNPLSFDAPVLWVGGELLRYGYADRIGPAEYRLRRLLRGWQGATDTAPLHPPNTEILLLEAETSLSITNFPTPIGATCLVGALGVGDMDPVERSILIEGNAIRPRPPVHGRIDWLADGGLSVRWVRRDRLLHNWANAVDVPDSENGGGYAVTLTIGAVPVASWSPTSETLVLGAAELAALSIPPASTLQFSIVQRGRFAHSAPLLLQITN